MQGAREAEASGAAAIVLKSIFEEEIAAEYENVLAEAKAKGLALESYEYYDYQIKGDRIAGYVELIRGAKKGLSIPVIASVNCTWSHEWASFARELEEVATAFEPIGLGETERRVENGWASLLMRRNTDE